MLENSFACKQVFRPLCLIGILGDTRLRMCGEKDNVEIALPLVKLSKKPFDNVCGMEELKPRCKVQLFLREAMQQD